MTRFSKYLTPAVAALALSSSLLVAPATTASALPLNVPTTLTSSVWGQRAGINYDAYRRHCSAPKPANAVASGTKITLKVKKQTSKTEKALAKAAGCSSSLVKKGRVYSNGMVSTEAAGANGSLTYGWVEASVKFPSVTHMHGGLWLQSTTGPEIDMIESYGNRITNVVHDPTEKRLYNWKKSSSWYKKSHTFKVHVEPNRVTFYVDGEQTATRAMTTGGASYFVVASLLTSDWEVGKIKNSKLSKAKMTVNWVRVTPEA